MLRADFHTHTKLSPCSNMSAEDLVRTALKRNLDVICVNDHNRIEGGLLVKKVAGKRLLIIPAEEISSEAGHVIVWKSDGKYSRDTADIFDRAKDEGSFTVVPHAFDFGRISFGDRLNEFKGKIGALEIFNARCVFKDSNERAKAFAEKNKIPKIVGSDAHFQEEVGRAVAVLDCEKNYDDIVECIRKGRVSFEVRKSLPFVHVKSMITKLQHGVIKTK